VHPAQDGTHWVLAHTNGGPPGIGLGTQGSPLQQSALVAHAVPPSPQFTLAQRGTPTLSCLHGLQEFPMHAQQSWFALQDVVGSLHTSPFGVQPMCCVQ